MCRALKRDRARAGRRSRLLELVAGGICDGALLERIWREHPPTRAVHLAAQAGVRYSIQAPRAWRAQQPVGFVET
ncbi:MAG: GDP-mannose 4,6-dehydratase [Rhodanobacteraceae bacterium]|nr:GDP-mannose 4,6-dehydratase [Rhodanobacteraceae bacterium]